MNFVLTFALCAACIAGGMWLQAQHYAVKEKQHAEQHLADERDRSKRAIRQIEVAIEAQAAANARESDLRRAAADARRALNGLSHASNRAVLAARSSHDACLVTSSNLSELLNTVAGAGGELAAQADRINSDRQTLIDAWPK